MSKLIFISASVYAEGTRDMTRMPRFVPYAGVSIELFTELHAMPYLIQNASTCGIFFIDDFAVASLFFVSLCQYYFIVSSMLSFLDDGYGCPPESFMLALLVKEWNKSILLHVFFLVRLHLTSSFCPQVFLLKSLPLRYFATLLAFYKIPGGPAGLFDWVQVSVY